MFQGPKCSSGISYDPKGAQARVISRIGNLPAMKPEEVGIVVVGVTVVVSVSVAVAVIVMTLVLEMVSTIVACQSCIIHLSPCLQKVQYEIGIERTST